MNGLSGNLVLEDISSMDNKENGAEYDTSAPIVFIRERSLFGDRRVNYQEWIKHEELYKSIGQLISASHITGLQRVNGMWRIYLDNLEDKALLAAEGIYLRGYHVPVLITNPHRLDGEETVRIRIQNIPLSVDDNIIKRTLTIKCIDIIELKREKLRIDGKLTNCDTGDRLITVKKLTFTTPLPRFMEFGQFKAKVIHKGQITKTLKCRKCLEDGHRTDECTGEWKCLKCMKVGHKQGDCDMESSESESEECQQSQPSTTHEDDYNTILSTHQTGDGKHTSTKASVKSPRRELRSSSQPKKQSHIDKFVKSMSANNGKPSRDRSRSIVRSSPTTQAANQEYKTNSHRKNDNNTKL